MYIFKNKAETLAYFFLINCIARILFSINHLTNQITAKTFLSKLVSEHEQEELETKVKNHKHF